MTNKLKKFEAQLSAKIHQIEAKLDTACTDVNQTIQPSLIEVQCQVTEREKVDGELSKRITVLEAALENLKANESIQQTGIDQAEVIFKPLFFFINLNLLFKKYVNCKVFVKKAVPL